MRKPERGGAIKLKPRKGGACGSPRAGPPMEKEGGVRSARSGKDLHACPHTTQRLTGLNCLPLCVAVLGAPHVIYDHAAAAAPVAAELCTSVALCSPNHGYPADHWGACNRDSRTCHVACVGEPRTEVERYSINFLYDVYRSLT